MRFGVLGSGPVGQVLAKGLKTHGYEVRIGSGTPEKMGAFAADTGIPCGRFEELASWADALVLAVLGRAAEAAITDAGPDHLSGKLVLDTTNPISDEPPEDGVIRFFTPANNSLMEQLQASFPEVHFVKAFNSVGSGSW